MPIATQLTDPVAHHGEGPVWWPDGHLRLVDMLAGDVVDLRGADVNRWHVGEVAALVRPRRAGGAVVAIERGIVLVDDDGRPELEPPPVWDDPSVRMNEGSCDRSGRFYCGSMAWDAAPARGTLYRFDGPKHHRVVLEAVTISNGLDFSADDATAFFVDTPTRRVVALDHDRDGGLSSPRTHVALGPGQGDPDGICLDAEGGLWVACWGGSAVRHYDRDGRLDEVVTLPVPQVTACTLGGPGLRTLFVTTSALDQTGPSVAGAVFGLDGVTPGLPVRPCAF